MTIQEILLEKRDNIIKDWISVIYGTYSIDTVGFLRTQSNQFANPVGHKTREAVPIIIDALLQNGADKTESLEPLVTALDEIIRIRSVQQFSADQALSVIVFLKNIIRKYAKPALDSTARYEELLDLESRIDSLVLMSVKIHTECCLKIEKMRVDEFKRKHYQLIRRAERILENPEGEPEK